MQKSASLVALNRAQQQAINTMVRAIRVVRTAPPRVRRRPAPRTEDPIWVYFDLLQSYLSPCEKEQVYQTLKERWPAAARRLDRRPRD